MTVNHKSSVQNFDIALKFGGTHSFEITPDEMPELEGVHGVDEGVEITCIHTDRDGVWPGIVNQIAAVGGHCTYRLVRKGFYGVTCTIPSRSMP